MKSGLVSISFRKIEVDKIIKETKNSGLDFVEWGGDVHVPMGKVKLAGKTKRDTYAGGVQIASYGSYYGVIYHCGETRPLNFKRVLRTAKALGAKTIRIWAGWPSWGCRRGKGCYACKGSCSRGVRITRELCNLAKKFGMTISIESHHATITDDYHDTLDFIKQVGCDNLKVYWQPHPKKSHEYNKESLIALLPYVSNVHVFNWRDGVKYPLKDAYDEWKEYIDILNDENAKDRILFLEFMPDGEITSLSEEAKTLNALIGGTNK